MIRYYVCGLGYDEDARVTDYEKYFGDFDTYDEAYDLFVKLQCRSDKSLCDNVPENIYQLLIQLEGCEEDDDEINCVDSPNAMWIINPNFKEASTTEEMIRRKRAYEAYKLDWMIQHGYTLTDLIKELQLCIEEVDEDGFVDLKQIFADWEFDYGFHSEVWVCYDEFCENEYQDKEYIKQLLGEE